MAEMKKTTGWTSGKFSHFFIISFYFNHLNVTDVLQLNAKFISQIFRQKRFGKFGTF
ncbi:hypothetical protein PRUB_b0456 [Pseudoalteromonas rubra]|uniref:Uncharacterized protein n=1 Tax=Pseudoalteromonas rubra TaxID=43658 RepID=A0A8T0BZQ0_9GAMM|nr:hypothetical protein PRUB_b0456 [Pseudoalteromonas rubra]